MFDLYNEYIKKECDKYYNNLSEKDKSELFNKEEIKDDDNTKRKFPLFKSLKKTILIHNRIKNMIKLLSYDEYCKNKNEG